MIQSRVMKSNQVALPFNMFDVVISGRIRRRNLTDMLEGHLAKTGDGRGDGKKHVRGNTLFWGGQLRNLWGRIMFSDTWCIFGITLHRPKRLLLFDGKEVGGTNF